MIRMHYLAPLALLAAIPAWAQSAAPAPQSAPATQQSPREAARAAKLGEALAAIRNGKAAEAIRVLDPLLAEYEKLHAGEKGQIFCAHNVKQAILYASEADAANRGSTVLGPDWCNALWARGFALIDLQQVDAAVPFLERAVALSPSHPHYLSELGYAYQAQKQWQRSYDAYARAAAGAEYEEGDQRNRSLRRAWFGMGYDLIELGRLDEAEKLLNRCLELFPDDQKVKSELQFIKEQRAKQS